MSGLFAESLGGERKNFVHRSRKEDRGLLCATDFSQRGGKARRLLQGDVGNADWLQAAMGSAIAQENGKRLNKVFPAWMPQKT